MWLIGAGRLSHLPIQEGVSAVHDDAGETTQCVSSPRRQRQFRWCRKC
ncbi:hypothetical protein HMPREF1549_02013 [Actinomyces johnsonii F0510]|uniref:Uncharacterized protein n=1 Tax=Actinomyces johnsonii F0510 TaxID=1227262 RepID=U1RI03_9ACTO|nr:hypothetical protein HMPREF1549_02013 [Actinomyces johnsonii F0510]